MDQYPGIPHHQIENHHVQRMHHLCSSSPPPPAIVPSLMWPPTVLPVQSYYVSNQLPLMGYQVFALPPQHPQAALENRIDYTAGVTI